MMPIKKSVYGLGIASLLSISSWAVRDVIEDYLENPIFPKKVMAIGEGEAYGNYDLSVYKVDIDSRAQPDLVDDVRQQAVLCNIPDACFDQLILHNIPTYVFNSDLENGSLTHSIKPLSIFQGLNRLLKPGGTLVFNDMWGGYAAEGERHKEVMSLATRAGMTNPFNQYLMETDWGEIGDKELPDTPIWPAYVNQLKTFFQNAGFSDIKEVQNSSEPLPKPWNAQTYQVPKNWFQVTK